MIVFSFAHLGDGENSCTSQKCQGRRLPLPLDLQTSRPTTPVQYSWLRLPLLLLPPLEYYYYHYHLQTTTTTTTFRLLLLLPPLDYHYYYHL